MTKAKYTKFQTRGRFYVVRDCDGWTVVDDCDGGCISFETKSIAMEEAKFCRDYVKKWGDIDLYVYPNSLDTPLHYCGTRDLREIQVDRPWVTETDILRSAVR